MSRLTKKHIVAEVGRVTEALERAFENYQTTNDRKYIGKMFDLHGRRQMLLKLIGASFDYNFIQRCFDFDLMRQLLKDL